jgi:hypothetical protein
MLIGAVAGGALGGLGGWAVGGEHYWALGGILAAGAGAAGATDSWDSYAGGFVGGLAGAAVGGGALKAYSEQFSNFRSGKGFVSNYTAKANEFAVEMKAKYALNANQKDSTVRIIQRPLGRNEAGDPGSTTGPRHRCIISEKLSRGKFEMGRYGEGGMIHTTDTVDNLSGWGTHLSTEKSLALGGRYIESFDVQVNMAALRGNISLYETTFAGKFSYNAGNHNSNFAVNSVIYGAGGDIPEAGWAPGFPDKP